MAKRAWLLHYGLGGYMASPVDVLSRGPKRARVRLRHKRREGGKWYPAGSTRYVPSDALASVFPRFGTFVSVGDGQLVPSGSPRGRRIARPIQQGYRVSVKRGRHAGRSATVLEQQTSFTTGKPLKAWVLRVNLSRGRKELAYERESNLEVLRA